MERMKAIDTYINSEGHKVTVYPEKKQKRIPWQRGEAYLNMKMRLPDDRMSCMVQFTRKNGKY